MTIDEQRPRRTIYTDGVFDLFHVGHLNAIRACAKMGDRVVIGVVGDEDCAQYKRRPVINLSDRSAIVRALRDVDEVISPCPLIVDDAFIDAHNIDLVVHGFSDATDARRQQAFYRAPMRRSMFREVQYHHGCSTTDILRRIRSSESE